MTALQKYQKLECPGLWRDDPNAQRRDVVVNLGDTSIVLSDPRNDAALAHWSLPAVQRLNPGERPAIYAPGPDAAETLELTDSDMIAALEEVHHAIKAVRPHPGRLRNGILAGVTAGIVALGVLWLPDALIKHTAAVVPAATRAEIGRLALSDLARLTGQPCAARLGQQALQKLANRVFGKGLVPQLHVVRDGLRTAILLPDRQIVLPEMLLAEADNPELASGFAMEQQIYLEQNDPMVPLLHHAGLRATFTLLTTGTLPPKSVSGYAEALVQSPHPDLPKSAILTRFEAAGIPTTPYAQTLDPSGESVVDLIEGDPFATVAPPPLLPDADWVSLQDICSS